MTLQNETKLAHYEITSLLGKGGMGEVYQAKDTKLGRDVAIKVLPEEFAIDPNRVARFQREAKLLASLNHPNIAAIHGLEESEGTHFLVMELIPGDTLADRIKKGPIPVEESLKLAIQIAEAVEAAHEKGVIHRDLKPSNIKITPEGKIKVLDFGLAKAFAGETPPAGGAELSNSPTLSDAATRQGVILGTAGYMSPEQATGKSVDKRTDIWAFGVVLFEMLTGKKLFEGETVTETIAGVIKSEPAWGSLPPELHPRIRFMLERCLKKVPKNRYSGISDARVDIQEVLSSSDDVFLQPVIVPRSRNKQKTALWVVSAVTLTAIVVGVAVWKLNLPEPRSVIRLDHVLPEGKAFNNQWGTNIGLGHTLAVSPDGSKVVYSTREGLYMRSVDGLNAELIMGTDENPQSPFFSPDGQWIGYWAKNGNQLKKINVRGGTSISICDVTWVLGANWYQDGSIIYAEVTKGILRVPAVGGTPEAIVEGISAFPQLLPGGKTLIYTNLAATPYQTLAYSMESGESKELFPGIQARYIQAGYLVYGLPVVSPEAGGTLFAVPFDPGALELKSNAVPLVKDTVLFAVSDTGTLAYIPYGQSELGGQQVRNLLWVDRQGREEAIHMPPDYYLFPSISPDGNRVALTKRVGGDTGNQHIWICDLVRETLTPLTTGKSSANHKPIWTRDGKRIVYISYREAGKSGIYWKAADGTGEEQVLVLFPADTTMLVPWSWSSDGKTLAMGTLDFATNPAHGDIETLSMEGDHTLKLVLHAEYNQTHPSISPDGKYIAYMSGEVETGQPEIFVRPFPDVGKGKWPISTGGGESPLWSPDSRELFYRNEGAVMAVSIDTKATFSAGKPRMLFQGPYVTGYNDSPAWDISPDGQKFLMIKQPSPTDKPDTAAGPRKINIVLNWLEELKERVPVE